MIKDALKITKIHLNRLYKAKEENNSLMLGDICTKPPNLSTSEVEGLGGAE